MAAKVKYRFFLNLSLLGFNILDKSKNYNFLISNSSSEKRKEENILLTLKIFADKQSDYDQKIYLAEGNVKAIINNGTLRSDVLRYDKSTGILSALGNVRFTKGKQHFIGKEFRFNLLKL